MARTTERRKSRVKRRRPRFYGGKFDVQKWIGKTGMEFHWPGYQFSGPRTKLEKQLKRGDSASIAWTELPSNMTNNQHETLIIRTPRIYKISEKRMKKWPRPLASCRERRPAPKNVKKIMQAKKKLKL